MQKRFWCFRKQGFPLLALFQCRAGENRRGQAKEHYRPNHLGDHIRLGRSATKYWSDLLEEPRLFINRSGPSAPSSVAVSLSGRLPSKKGWENLK
jgi:hypothetical protein